MEGENSCNTTDLPFASSDDWNHFPAKEMWNNTTLGCKPVLFNWNS